MDLKDEPEAGIKHAGIKATLDEKWDLGFKGNSHQEVNVHRLPVKTNSGTTSAVRPVTPTTPHE